MSDRGSDLLHSVANYAARLSARPTTLFLAFAFVVAWLCTGPYFSFGPLWQIAFSTGTTIVMFLMVFVIQDTQTRAMAVLHLKLDELIRATASARNELLNIEKLTQKELDTLLNTYAELAKGEHHPGTEALRAVQEAVAESQQSSTVTLDTG